MAPKDQNMLTAIDGYTEFLDDSENPKASKNKIKQFNTSVYRMVATGRGGPSSLGMPKMTASHLLFVRVYYATQPYTATAELMADFQEGVQRLSFY